MGKTRTARPRKRDLLWFAFAALLPLPWIVTHNLDLARRCGAQYRLSNARLRLLP